MYQPFGFFAAAADSGIGYGNPPCDRDWETLRHLLH